MTIKDFFNDIENLKAIKEMIAKDLKNEFDSHDFIRVFQKKFEPDYVNFLNNYKLRLFRTVNAQIAINLLKNKEYLKIQNKGKVKIISVFGYNVKNEKWVKVN